MYYVIFTTRLRLPLTKLYCQLANYLGLSINQIAPNAWRIFIGAEVIWGQLSGENHQLTLDEFFYCYKPKQISSSKGIYHFLARKSSLRLMSDMPNSNINWKNRYFFVQGTEWVCKPDEWASIPNGFDNTWGIVKESGESSAFVPWIALVPCLTLVFFSCFQPPSKLI